MGQSTCPEFPMCNLYCKDEEKMTQEYYEEVTSLTPDLFPSILIPTVIGAHVLHFGARRVTQSNTLGIISFLLITKYDQSIAS